jgi:hypothetical protein
MNNFGMKIGRQFMADALSIPVPFDDGISRHARVFSGERLETLAYQGKAAVWARLDQSELISNWHAQAALLKLEQTWLPLGVGHRVEQQTYLASPQHGYIDYARDELDQLQNEKTKRWAERALSVAEPWFSLLALDRAVSVNAWGVSTHLYPQWSLDKVSLLTDTLVKAFDDRPLWMRTLNEVSDGKLMSNLIENGWQLWPSRQIYVFDPKNASNWANRRNNQIDQKLLRSTPLQLVLPHEFLSDDAPAMAQLYAMLYLDKHSRWNAHYNTAYFIQAIQQQWLDFYGFRDESGQLIAFIGVFADKRTMTTPMLGYDTSLPQNMGLYRLLMGKVMALALERNLYLNLGAGSASFKKMRGGQPILEWHAFYGRHLPIWQSSTMRLTAWLMGKTVPSFLAKQGV